MWLANSGRQSLSRQEVSCGRRSSTSTSRAIADVFLGLARSPFCSPQPASVETDDTTTGRVVVAVSSAYGNGGEDDILHKDEAALGHFKLLRDAVFKGMDCDLRSSSSSLDGLLAGSTAY